MEALKYLSLNIKFFLAKFIFAKNKIFKNKQEKV